MSLQAVLCSSLLHNNQEDVENESFWQFGFNKTCLTNEKVLKAKFTLK